MRRAVFEKFGRIASSVKPSVLRYFYRDLTGDNSASCDLEEAEIDKRVQEVIEMEPESPTTVIDLREVKHTESRTKFDVFWAEAEKYLNEDIGTAVDDRRHAQITHLAKAISIRDFRQQVASHCPEGTPPVLAQNTESSSVIALYWATTNSLYDTKAAVQEVLRRPTLCSCYFPIPA